MKYSYNPEEMAKEFDLEQIYRKLTSQCQSYMVRADRFFQETDGALSQMQKPSQGLRNKPKQRQSNLMYCR